MSKLRAHQVAPALRLIELLRHHESALDESDTGIGKTAHACEVIATLDRPTLCVIPKISVTGWKRMLDLFGTGASLINYEMLRTGRTPYGKWEFPGVARAKVMKCVSCQLEVNTIKPAPCYVHHLGIHCVEPKSMPHKYGKFSFSPAIKLLIFDEIHRCGGLDSLNAAMLIAARRQGIKTLGLSATPATTPLGMRALGYLLDLHKLTDFFTWARRFGVQRHPMYPGAFIWMAAKETQRDVMESIGRLIIPARGVRVRTTDVPGFPTRIVQTIAVDIESPEKMNAAHEAMREALNMLKDKAASDKAPEHPLTKILRARQQVELLKVPATVELAQDFLAKGMSVALFVNFTQTVDELCKRLKTECKIDGRNKGDERTRFIDGFQADEQRIIVLNSEAGGIAISLHDTRGDFPRVGLVFPGYSAVVVSQVLGRLHRDGGKSPAHYRFVFAAKTIDVRVQRAFENKLDNLAALCDSDLIP